MKQHKIPAFTGMTTLWGKYFSTFKNSTGILIDTIFTKEIIKKGASIEAPFLKSNL